MRYLENPQITLYTSQISLTLPKTNIARKNRPSQKESSLPTIHFQGLLLLVSGSVFSPKNCQYPLKNAGTERRSFPFEILPFRWHLFIFETWGASGSGSETATRLPEKIHGYGWPLSSPERKWEPVLPLEICTTWVCPKIGVSQNGWFIRENPIKMNDLGKHPYFWKHPHLWNEPPKNAPSLPFAAPCRNDHHNIDSKEEHHKAHECCACCA